MEESRITTMANFNGTWKFVSRENNERILELMGCPWEMRKKIMLGIEKVKSVCKWDISTTTLVITTKVLDLKSEVQMKIGDPYVIGPHAPGLTGIIHAMSDDFLKGKIRDRTGEEIGTWESNVDGKTMTTKTTIKGETSSIVMKKTK